ncbi:WSSV362 [White spot syndrome virus]|uniref:WSSV362 n=1 Tax=White spot syndrome virus TaxID=342409 RepID=A0A2I6SC56_9VIRU|nr:WSSV362 [White spot syndrome virus]
MKELEAENNKEGGRVEVEVEGVEQQQPSTSGKKCRWKLCCLHLLPGSRISSDRGCG